MAQKSSDPKKSSDIYNACRHHLELDLMHDKCGSRWLKN
jgi:hypothetical protein